MIEAGAGPGRSFAKWLLKAGALHRARYALVALVAEAEIIERPPPLQLGSCSRVPRSFRGFAARALRDAPPDGLARAKRLSFGLSFGHRRGSALSTGATRALSVIVAGRGGVCSDYTQVFVGLCAAAGIASREWGVSFDGMSGGRGHSFCEVYSERLARWVLIDPFHSYWAACARTGEPIGVREVRARGRAARKAWACPIDPTVRPILARTPQRSLDEVAEPRHVAFVLLRNDVFAAERVSLGLGRPPRLLWHAAMVAVGVHPAFLVYPGGDDVHALRRLVERRRRAWAPLVAVASACHDSRALLRIGRALSVTSEDPADAPVGAPPGASY